MDSRKFYGVYRGTVFDNRDPINSNRLRLLVPQILGSNPTEWAWGTSPASTKVAPPAFGQGVLVMFEGGDPVYPIWVGVFGTNTDSSKHGLISPVAAGTSLPNGVVTTELADGTVSIDVLASLVALGNRIAALEAYNASHP
jgi:hypothetical protein